jgi:hypothetical protein
MPDNELDVYQKRELTADAGAGRIAPSQQRMLESLGMADIFVRMQHLSQLENAQIVPLPKRELAAEPQDRVRLLHFSTLNYDSGEDVFSKLSGVFSAVSAVDCSAVFIVHHDGVKTDVYMGTACSDTQILTNAFETMRHAVDGHFRAASRSSSSRGTTRSCWTRCSTAIRSQSRRYRAWPPSAATKPAARTCRASKS